MSYELKNKYNFVYDEDCCESSAQNETVICGFCHEQTCADCTVMLDGIYLHRACSASRRKDIKLLESFQLSNLKVKEALSIENFDFDVSEIVYRDKASCSVSIETEKLLASLIMWDSGECELSVLGKITNSLVFYIYRVLNNKAELESYLNDIYNVLREIKLNT